MGLLQDGKWVDQWYDTESSGGHFVRKAPQFRSWVTVDGTAGPSGDGGFKAESGRYHLYVSLACPWAHRTLIFRALKELEQMISVSAQDLLISLRLSSLYDSIPPTVGDFMNNLYWLSEDQMGRLRPYFPMSRGRARVDDRRVLSGIIFINRNGLRWCDAPKQYGPYKTLYNRWKRWSDMGVFARIMEGLAAKAPDNKTISIDATYLKAHRTASSLGVKKGGVDV